MPDEKSSLKKGTFFYFALNVLGKWADNKNEIGIGRYRGTENKLEGMHA